MVIGATVTREAVLELLTEVKDPELPMIDVQPAVGEQTRHVGLRLVLTVGAADALLLHDVGNRGDERILEFGDRLQHAGTSMRSSRHAAERTAAKFAPRRPRLDGQRSDCLGTIPSKWRSKLCARTG